MTDGSGGYSGGYSGAPSGAFTLPPIRRARDYHLYTRDGRLTDLWQYGGAALLGHTPPGLLRELKNTASRGLLTPLPSLGNRFARALSRLFPRRDFRCYADETGLRRALREGGIAGWDAPFPDPAREDVPGELSLWRPFLQNGETQHAPGAEALAVPDIPVLIPILPLPWTRLSVLALEASVGSRLPPSDTLSPAVLNAAARSVHDLINSVQDRIGTFPKINRALREGPWRRRGIYFFHRDIRDGAAWKTLFRHFLDRGFLLPPDWKEPAILPALLSPGEEAALAALLRPLVIRPLIADNKRIDI
jgi:hypothetical protein